VGAAADEPIFVLGRNGTADARLDNAWAVEIATRSGEEAADVAASAPSDEPNGAAPALPLRSEL